MISATSLIKRFAWNIEAVASVSFDLDQGRFLAIVGRSGSGKSSLLAMIGGLSRPTSGDVTIDGRNLWAMAENERSELRNRSIGFVFQFANLLPTLRAIDNVALPSLIGRRIGPQVAYARAHSLLNRVGLGDRIESYPGQLSGGEQRRVAIARALINSPSLVLADEPTADLDQETEQEILGLLLDIHRTERITLVIVTHNSAIAGAADSVMRMYQGHASIVPAGEVDRSIPLTTQIPPAPLPATSTPVAPPISPASDIVDPNSTATEPVRLGEGLQRFVERFLLWGSVVVLLGYALNWGVARHQQALIQQRIAERIELEEFAMSGLRADVKDITSGPGNTYLLTLYLSNTAGGRPIYVMAPTVRAFVQVGTNWNEIPMRPLNENPDRVLKIVGKQ